MFQVTSETTTLPGGAFATCSADGTIRLWHLDLGQEGPVRESSISTLSSSDRPPNVYSKDILGVLYIGWFLPICLYLHVVTHTP